MLFRTALKNATFRRTSIGLIGAGLLLISNAGCYGRFPLTSMVYNWNGRVTNNHIVNSIIMIVLVIVPVYGICMFVDGLIVNSIEYWSGEKTDISTTTTLPDGSVAMLVPSSDPGRATFTISKDGITLVRRTYIRTDATHTNILDEEGNLLTTVECLPNGDLQITDTKGTTVGYYDKSQLAALKAAQKTAPQETASLVPAAAQ